MQCNVVWKKSTDTSEATLLAAYFLFVSCLVYSFTLKAEAVYPPKRSWTSTRLHNVTSQKIAFFRIYYLIFLHYTCDANTAVRKHNSATSIMLFSVFMQKMTAYL
jgi:hypothetical protein